jgi:hypothetical protein
MAHSELALYVTVQTKFSVSSRSFPAHSLEPFGPKAKISISNRDFRFRLTEPIRF